MTSGEAQRAFEQQTPVMFRWLGGWVGPTFLSHRSLRVGWRVACDIRPARWVAASELRLATAHELLTADEDA